MSTNLKDVNDVIEIASLLLKDSVGYSRNVLDKCKTSTYGEEGEDFVVLTLHQHMIEMATAVEVLVSQGMSFPAIAVVRSSFEALLAIEYILEKDEDYVRRSFSWLVAHIHDRSNAHERFDVSSEKGKYFEEFIDRYEEVSEIELPRPEKVQKTREALHSLLDWPQLRPIEAEYNRHKRTPRWYQMFEGPSNLRELAEHLNQEALYEILYRDWSAASHAHDFLPFISMITDNEFDELEIGDSRSLIQTLEVKEVKHVCVFALGFLLRETRLILEKFHSEEDPTEWNKLRDRHKTLCSL